MLSRLQAARSVSTGSARITLVWMLALVLLAGLIPAGALSASRSCQMDCCAGKPPHEAGACHAFLTPAVETEPAPQAAADEHASQHQEMQMHGAETESAAATTTLTTLSDYCRRAQPAHHASAPSTTKGSAGRRPIVRAAQSFTTPCSEECAAAAGMLVPRPRETAALASAALRPRPPALASGAPGIFDLKASSTEQRRRIRPRAPPASLVNL